MLGWVIMFFVLALVAAIFGFGGLASGFASVAQVLFFVFLALLVVSVAVNAFRGRGPRV